MKRKIVVVGLLFALLLVFTGCNKQSTNSQLNIQNTTTNSCDEYEGNDGKLPEKPDCVKPIQNQCDSATKC